MTLKFIYTLIIGTLLLSFFAFAEGREDTSDPQTIAYNAKGQMVGEIILETGKIFFINDKESGIEILEIPIDSEITHINNQGQIAGTNSLGVFIWDSLDGYYEVGLFDTGHHKIVEFHDNGQLLVTTHFLIQEAHERKHGVMNWSPITGLYTFVSESGDYALFNSMENLFAYVGEDSPSLYQTRAYLWDQGSITELTTNEP